MPKCYTVYADTREITREQWLQNRRSGIGGSDAGGILGVSPYKSAYSVWADKLGYTDAAEDNEAMRQGRDLEDYVARRFAEKTRKRVVHDYGMMRSKRYPWMVANIDRRIAGERAGLECKTSKDIHLKRYKNGDFPIEYYSQCLHYMAVTGWESWYLAVLVYGTELLVFEIRREDVEDDLRALIEAEERFWHDYVEPGRHPEPDGLASTTSALKAVWSASEPNTSKDAGEAEEALLGALAALKRKKKDIEKQIAAAENRIKAAMGEAEVLNGMHARATWRSMTVRRLSESKIRELLPGVNIESLKETTEQRRFALKMFEEE